MAIGKKCVAMLLAGGQGSRLVPLTNTIAKPAVYFGGKYRIIDFPLSNCVNSGIDTVGVLTQYQPLVLNDYIGTGQPWDLDRNYGGAHVLPPYQRTRGSDWYKGTANAIYQNINFLENYNPEYVLILSGDHIYTMDYNKMLQFHRDNKADCTIAVLNVSLKEASRFGIMNTDKKNRITEFEEKPKEPKSTKASMGIYIFTYKVLKEYLEMDEADENSDKDFGKNVIPRMLSDGKKMYAYDFEGYWKDVGTLSSLWEANMDMLGDDPALDIDNDDWKIYYRHTFKKPHYVGMDAAIKNTIIAEGCEVNGYVENSVLFAGVVVEKGAVIKDSVIMPNTHIGKKAIVNYVMTDADVIIGKDAVVGMEKNNKKSRLTVLGNSAVVKAGHTVEAGSIISDGEEV